eukprot:1409098-Karenia_brevis.AAC.1
MTKEEIESAIDEKPPFDTIPSYSRCKAFTGNVRIATWNAQALLGVNAQRSHAKKKYCKTISARVDVMFVQEAHGTVEDVRELTDELRTSHKIWLFPGMNTATGGLLILAARDFLQ